MLTMATASSPQFVHAILTPAEWELIQQVRRIDRRDGYAVDLAAELRAQWDSPAQVFPFARPGGEWPRPPSA
jgi:hypothetical protein